MNKNQELFHAGAAYGAVAGLVCGFVIEYTVNKYNFEPKLIKDMTPVVVIYEHPRDDSCYVHTLRFDSFKVPIIRGYDSYPLLKNGLR